MAIHRFREQIESLSRVSAREGFVPCPAAVMQMLSPDQQSAAQQIYQFARSVMPQQAWPARGRFAFSAN